MHKLITMELSATTSEERFTLDELVLAVEQVFEQGAAKVGSLILQLVDELLALRHTSGKSSPRKCKCEHSGYEMKDRLKRQLRTSLGTIDFNWRRLQCTHCQATWVPLREFLGLERWQSKSSELEQVVTEITTEQSYRRSSRHLSIAGQLQLPKSTLQRWVVQSDAGQWDPPEKKPDLLMADGTGYKRRPDPATGQTNAGELRVVLGRRADGQWVSYGAWSGKSWAEINELLKGTGPQPAIHAEALISDGETGLGPALANLANRQQRSHWHMVRDLRATLWHDDAPATERKAYAYELKQLLGIEVPAGDLEAVSAQDKVTLEQRVEQAQHGINELIKELSKKGYHKAANYIQTAQGKLFHYVEFWLRTGLVCPRTTSFLERLMRELGRRLKRIAFGWSEEGAAQMARLILRRITDPAEWKAYWKKRLGLEGRVQLSLRHVKAMINPQILGP